jgi:c-di-GMP phosphodiesterase
MLGERHSEALFAGVVRALRLWTITVDDRDEVSSVNEAYERSTGFEAEEVEGKPVGELISLEHEREHLKDALSATRRGSTSGLMAHMHTRGGEDRLVEWSALSIARPPSTVLLIGIDRTESQRAVEVMRTDRDWHHQLVSQLPAILWTTDTELHFTSGIGAGLRNLGLREDQMIGTPLARYFGGEADPNVQAHRAALKGETVALDSDWLGRAFRTVITPFRQPDEDEPSGTIGLAIDITERVRAEAERDRSLDAEREARRRAEKAIRTRDEFISIAAHELYTPMTSLQLALQAVLSRDVEGVSATRLLRLAEKQTQRLLTLIQDLLDVSRIDERQLHIRPSAGDLAALARHVGARFAPEFERASSTFTVRADAAVVGVWDSERLDQVMTNLLTNALRHAPGSSVELEVERVDDRARITVRDRGPGITTENVGRIFERFERATSIEHHGGLGLGLYIVRQIAEAHGGSAAVSARPGGGTVFSVELPISAGQDTAP